MAEATTDVTAESAGTETSSATDPMSTTPVERTDAQEAEAGVVDSKPSDEAREQVKQDAEWRAENPNKVLIREANPKVGGESFAYLDAGTV